MLFPSHLYRRGPKLSVQEQYRLKESRRPSARHRSARRHRPEGHHHAVTTPVASPESDRYLDDFHAWVNLQAPEVSRIERNVGQDFESGGKLPLKGNMAFATTASG